MQDRTQRLLGLALAVGLALLDLGDEHEDLLPQGRLLGRGQHPPRGPGERRQLACFRPQFHQPLAHRRVGRIHLEHPQHRTEGRRRISQWALV